MTGQQAITEICKILAAGNVGVRIFKNRRETNFSGSEYIVVNHLSFPQESGLQYGYANINIHVKDADTGEPDSGRIDHISALVLPLFKETEDAEGNLPDLKSGKMPLVYTLNWNGNFNNVFKTRWSASVMNEAKSHNMYYYALGNELNLGKWNAFVDFMYSKEDIDRKGIITSIVGRPGGHNAFDANYLSVVAKCNYRFLPKWNVFVKGMYETASVGKASEGIEKGNYRTSWGYLGGIEYYPMETNLHFFVTYVGRSYDFTSRAKVLGQENYSTNRISVGFIWQMPVF